MNVRTDQTDVNLEGILETISIFFQVEAYSVYLLTSKQYSRKRL